MTEPVVSFCIANHNYGRFLAPMLDALLAQSYPRVDIVVVDDGSTDDSRDVLARYADRIVVDLQDQAGQAAASNRAFELSRGDIVVFHDSDDVLYGGAAARLVAAFEDPAVTTVFSRLDDIDEGGIATGGHRPPDGCPLWGGDLRALVLEHCAFYWPETTGQAHRRTFVESVMPMPDFPPDFYLSHLGALAGLTVALDEPIGQYRVHGRNLSLVPTHRGREWLEARLEERRVLYDCIRTYSVEHGLLSGDEAARWMPHDYITAGLELASARLAHAPGGARWAWQGARWAVGHPQLRRRTKARHAAWFLVAGLLPGAFARRTIAREFPHTTNA